MPWFKVDDSAYDHPKLFDAPDAAVALWLRAGCWAARNLTDGHIPARLPSRLCDDPETAVAELLARGLWEPVADGYVYHDWLEYQPSRDEVKAGREAAKERMRRIRSQRRSQGSSPERSGEQSENFDAGSRPPTRPDPELPKGSSLPASPPASAASDEVDVEIVEEPAAEETAAGAALEVVKPVTAQTIVRALVDECKRKDIALPKRLIGQYAKGIKELLDEHQPPQRIWAALSLMASENLLNRPSLLANKVVTVQTGPERAPQRAARSTTDDRVAEWLNFDEELAA
jgi:hypothetical protein